MIEIISIYIKVKDKRMIKIDDEEFKVIRQLGSGSFGEVYTVTLPSRGNRQEYALKVIRNKGIEGIKSLRELDIMRRIRDNYLMNAEMVVTEYDKKQDISITGILMKKADRDLFSAMYDKNIDIHKRLNFLYQILIGTRDLHSAGYLHLRS